MVEWYSNNKHLLLQIPTKNIFRYGLVTSTTVGKTLRVLGLHHQIKSDNIRRLNSAQKKDLVFVLELCGYDCQPLTSTQRHQRTNTLIKQSKKQLVDLCTKYGITGINLSCTKEELALKLVRHEMDHGKTDLEHDIQKLFIQTNFMFPIRKKELTMGILNEPCVVKALPFHVSLYSLGKGDYVIMDPGIVEIGLAINNEHQYLGTSVDGLCKIEGLYATRTSNRHIKTVVVEVKSKVSETTAINAVTYKRENGIAAFNSLRVSSVDKSTQVLLRKFVPDSDHLAQVWFDSFSLCCTCV